MTYILLAPTVWETAEVLLWVSLVGLILVIAYKRLLRALGKDIPPKENYCVLYGLEENPVSGEVEFYFTSEKKKQFTLSILDAEMNDLKEIISKESHIGGNIIRFDSSNLPNGDYYYCLKTDNQKTMKKMMVLNQ